MEKWSLAGEKSNWEPICSISKIQSFCCIPKIANKSLLSFLDIQMCFISSFTSERVDLPEDEREESVAMAEGYNYIKTLPSKQWAITLPRTLRSPACARARARLLSLQRAFTYFPERGWHLGRDVLSQTWFLLTLTVPCALSSIAFAPTVTKWYPHGSRRLRAENLGDQFRKVSVLTVTLKEPTFPQNHKRIGIHASWADSQRAAVNAKSRA